MNDTKVLPGIGDHDMVMCNVSTKHKLAKWLPRTVHLYRKADWISFRKFMSSSQSEILSNHANMTIDDMWVKFKNKIDAGIKQFVPSKRLSTKISLPWITQ